jgi:hypothetical protein
VWNVFRPHLPFLDWVLRIVANQELSAHPLGPPATREAVTVLARPKPSATARAGAGKVRAYVDVRYRFARYERAHGICLSYEGPDASEMRWLQFIWREVVPDQGHPAAGALYHQGAPYPLTTDPTEPSQIGWNTDTATYLGGPAAAFYETDNAVNRSSGRLEMFDEPSAPSVADANAPCVSRAHLTQYLVKGNSVLFRTEFEIEHRIVRAGATPTAKARLISAKPATAIDPGPRARLHAQFNDLDYLP